MKLFIITLFFTSILHSKPCSIYKLSFFTPIKPIMWDLCYLDEQVPSEPFNIVINKLCQFKSYRKLNDMMEFATQNIISKSAFEKLNNKQLTNNNVKLMSDDVNLQNHLSELSNDFLTIAMSDDKLKNSLDNIQIQSRFGSNIHYVNRFQSQVVLPKGCSEFKTVEKLHFSFFPLHGKTNIQVFNNTNNKYEDIIVDIGGEVEEHQCRTDVLKICTDLPVLVMFRRK